MNSNRSGHVPANDVIELRAALGIKWAQIEPFVLAGQARVSPTGVELDEEELDLLKIWAGLFKEEIEAVRHVRDYVVHLSASAVPISKLVEANEFADRLLHLLIARIPKLEAYVEVATPRHPWWELPRT